MSQIDLVDLVYMALGLVYMGIGVSAGILLAPKSGRETRELLAKKAVWIRQTVAQEIQSISDAFNAGREAYRHSKPNATRSANSNGELHG